MPKPAMLALLFLAVLALAIVWALSASKNTDPASAISSLKPEPMQSATVEMKTKLTTEQPLFAELHSLIPTIATIRAEVAKDPHTTPPSLRHFAEILAARMTPALADSLQAQQLYAQLQNCSAEASAHLAIRSSCAYNAKRLVKKYGSQWGITADAFMDQLAPTVRTQLQTMEGIY